MSELIAGLCVPDLPRSARLRPARTKTMNRRPEATWHFNDTIWRLVIGPYLRKPWTFRIRDLHFVFPVPSQSPEDFDFAGPR
ncbi:hypothetical protein MPLSOD_120230 [Mesorhizobium sp. SOD10]|nr:hypothetical protein MPLSOD_120230 [Mesorhizobium sp. SOD10]